MLHYNELSVEAQTIHRQISSLIKESLAAEDNNFRDAFRRGVIAGAKAVWWEVKYSGQPDEKLEKLMDHWIDAIRAYEMWQETHKEKRYYGR